jgi:hypothetical protein
MYREADLIGLSNRALNALWESDIGVDDLPQYNSISKLVRLPCIGRKVAKEILEWMAEKGIPTQRIGYCPCCGQRLNEQKVEELARESA